MAIMNTLIRSSARASTRSRGAAMSPAQVSQDVRRTYATQRPILPEGSKTQLMVAAIIGIPVLAYVMLPSSPAATGKPAANPGLPPNLDPAARKREKDSDEPDIPKVHAPRA